MRIKLSEISLLCHISPEIKNINCKDKNKPVEEVGQRHQFLDSAADSGNPRSEEDLFQNHNMMSFLQLSIVMIIIYSTEYSIFLYLIIA